MALNKEPVENYSPFEIQLQAAESALHQAFNPACGSNVRENLVRLRTLLVLNKSQMEAFLSSAFIISLNDEEYERLQLKIRDLFSANALAAREMGLDPDALF
ncbi:MAG: hypothetical protein AAB802_01160 [Patescibacteria group bacterium]|mgnify:CR=1 FL=1